MKNNSRIPHIVLLLVILMLAVSYIFCRDRFTWILEVFPILIALPILLLTYSRFKLTNLLYILLCIHASILCLGATYSYAQVPLGYWMQDLFGFARNHYDRIGHFAQGFIPAILARELLLRTSPLRQGKWLAYIVLSICLGISALYELIEAGTSMSMGKSADAFLGSQGDIWDAQWDMFFCLIGAVAALVFLSKMHDRYLTKISVKKVKK